VYFADFDQDGRPEVVTANKGDQDAANVTLEEKELKHVSIFVLPDKPLNGDLWREQLVGKLRMHRDFEPCLGPGGNGLQYGLCRHRRRWSFGYRHQCMV